MRVQGILSENLCNRSPGIRALVIRKETPSTLPVGCPEDSLPELIRQYRVVITPCNDLVLLLSSTSGPALPGSPFRLCVPYQARMDTPLPEVHPPGYLRPDLLSPADTQRLCEDDVGEDKGLLRFPTPAEYPPPFRSQYGREAAPYCARGRGIPLRLMPSAPL